MGQLLSLVARKPSEGQREATIFSEDQASADSGCAGAWPWTPQAEERACRKCPVHGILL